MSRKGTQRPQMFIFDSCHKFDVEPMTSTQLCRSESQDNVSGMESQGMDGKSLPGIYWKEVTEVEDADSEDPVTPVHVWPDTDEEWNDEYLNDLSGLKCQTAFNLQPVLSQVGQASLPCFNDFNVHLAVPVPSSSPPQGTGLCLVSHVSHVSHPISKDSITPMSKKSTCTTLASATPSLDSESEDEKPQKHEKLGDLSKPISFPRSDGSPGSVVDHPNESPLKQAIRTGALALKKARALMPAVNLEPDMKPMKVKFGRKATSLSQVQVLPTGQVHR